MTKYRAQVIIEGEAPTKEAFIIQLLAELDRVSPGTGDVSIKTIGKEVTEKGRTRFEWEYA